MSIQIERLAADVRRSMETRRHRLMAMPEVLYPSGLPVVEQRAEIAAAIAAHQVIVVCGETGSGKTTQLPKICLESGRGWRG